eukprot:4734507-Karenia_brevis.AAC.1
MERAERQELTSSTKASRSTSLCCLLRTVLLGVATWKGVHKADLFPVITAISLGDSGIEHVAA